MAPNHTASEKSVQLAVWGFFLVSVITAVFMLYHRILVP